MSHDRGCPCGRENYEYKDCDRGDDCYKWDRPTDSKSSPKKLVPKPIRGMILMTEKENNNRMLMRLDTIQVFFESDDYTVVILDNGNDFKVSETFDEIQEMLGCV